MFGASQLEILVYPCRKIGLIRVEIPERRPGYLSNIFIKRQLHNAMLFPKITREKSNPDEIKNISILIYMTWCRRNPCRRKFAMRCYGQISDYEPIHSKMGCFDNSVAFGLIRSFSVIISCASNLTVVKYL